MRWGSRVVDLIGYWTIAFIMSRYYNIHGWDIFFLMITIFSIQAIVRFINEIVEY